MQGAGGRETRINSTENNTLLCYSVFNLIVNISRPTFQEFDPLHCTAHLAHNWWTWPGLTALTVVGWQIDGDGWSHSLNKYKIEICLKREKSIIVWSQTSHSSLDFFSFPVQQTFHFLPLYLLSWRNIYKSVLKGILFKLYNLEFFQQLLKS